MSENEFLKQAQLFKLFIGVNSQGLQQFFNHFKAKKLNKGQFLFKEGDPSKELYFLKEGSLFLYKEDDLITIVEKSNFLGEIGLLLDQPRALSAYCNKEVELLAIEKKDFVDLCGLDQDFKYTIFKNLSSIIKNSLLKNTELLKTEKQSLSNGFEDCKETFKELYHSENANKVVLSHFYKTIPAFNKSKVTNSIKYLMIQNIKQPALIKEIKEYTISIELFPVSFLEMKQKLRCHLWDLFHNHLFFEARVINNDPLNIHLKVLESDQKKFNKVFPDSQMS